MCQDCSQSEGFAALLMLRRLWLAKDQGSEIYKTGVNQPADMSGT